MNLLDNGCHNIMTNFISVHIEHSNEEILLNPHYITHVDLDDCGKTTLWDAKGNGMCVKETLVDMKLKLCNML